MKRNLKNEKLYQDLEEVVCKLFSDVRKIDGGFKTGSCELHGKRVLFLNNRQSIEERISALAKEIANSDIEDIYLKPVVRAELAKVEGQLSQSVEQQEANWKSSY